jgi:hypothetical protein
MLRPFLLVGVGGSGGKTLRVIRDSIEAKLRSSGWSVEDRGFPKAWQFLQIDVASAPDGDDPDLPRQLPATDFFGMVSSGLTYSAMDGALAQRLTFEQQLDSLGGWRPDPNKVQVAITRGAGQYRALGRMITLNRLDQIKQRVDRAVDAITDADVAGELGELTRLLAQGEPRTRVAEPVVIVISSIAGGSGAGGVLEVCDVIRSAGRTWLDDSIGILYAPDVFDEIPEAARRGVRPNALATLSELLAGGWSYEGRDGGITDSSARLYQSSGISTASISRLGPRYPILVGARNADVSYGSQNEIYRGMGRALAEWVTQVRLQDSMGAYATTNRQAAALALPDNLGLKQAHHDPPFTALGFARLSVGRDFFERYTAQYLARAAITRINTKHLDARLPDDRRTDRQIVEELADQAWPRFLADSGLDERGVDSNDVLDRIRPDNRKEVASAWREKALARLRKGATRPEGLPALQWQSRVEQYLREEGPDLGAQLRSRRLAQAREWVQEIQTKLVNHVLKTVATHGGPVTLELLERLDQEVKDAVRGLPEEREQMLQKSRRSGDDIRAAFGASGDVPANSPSLEKAVISAAKSIGFEAEADLLGLVEELLRDLIPKLLLPITRAVSDALEISARDARRNNGERSKIENWPHGDDVPALLRPSKNEFLLDDDDKFPETMRRLLQSDTGATTPGDAEARALFDIITGVDSRGDNSNRANAAWTPRHSWVPEVGDLHEVMSGPTPAALEVYLGADELLKRADGWIQNDQTQFGRYLKQSLSDFLADPNVSEGTRQDRLQRFRGRLQATISRARPLVQIDNKLLSLVHGKDAPVMSFAVDSIPVPRGSEAAKIAREVVATSASGVDIDKLFSDDEGQGVSVFGILLEPYEPVVFTSLMRPMADEWAEVRLSPDARQSFWTWRRSRPLPEYIPAAPAIRRSMVRGWFTAQLLDQIAGQRANDQSGMTVWGPGRARGTGEERRFPYPLLAVSKGAAEAPAAALGSLPLALLDVFATQTLDPLRAYHRLRDLGASGNDQGYETYETLNQELHVWIEEGRVLPGAPVPHARVGTASDTPQERREKVLTQVDQWRKNYKDAFDRHEGSGNAFAVTREYELRHDLLEALDDLADALAASALQDDDGFA